MKSLFKNPTTRERAFEALIAAAGVNHSMVSVCKTVERGYTLHANKPLHKGKEILSIPPRLYVPYSAANAVAIASSRNPEALNSIDKMVHDAFGGDKEKHKESVNSLTAAICLGINITLTDKNDEYINLLRGNPITVHPLLMSRSLVSSSLAGTGALRKILDHKKIFEYVGESFFGQGTQRSKAFLWSMSTILSRALSSQYSPFTLVPLLDLVNHAHESNAQHTFIQNRFVLHTTREVEEGAELSINYGPNRSSASFLRLYGFLPDQWAESTRWENDVLEMEWASAHDLAQKRTTISMKKLFDASATPCSLIKSVPLLEEAQNIIQSGPNSSAAHVKISTVGFLLSSIDKAEQARMPALREAVTSNDSEIPPSLVLKWREACRRVINAELTALSTLREMLTEYRTDSNSFKKTD
jgi:hypothetical protein